MNLDGAIYPINVIDAKGNCIYTEFGNGKYIQRTFHEDPTAPLGDGDWPEELKKSMLTQI